MPNITYLQKQHGVVGVHLNGAYVGDIKPCDWNVLRNPVRWHYKPRGGKPGDPMSSIDAVKRSIEQGDSDGQA